MSVNKISKLLDQNISYEPIKNGRNITWAIFQNGQQTIHPTETFVHTQIEYGPSFGGSLTALTLPSGMGKSQTKQQLFDRIKSLVAQALELPSAEDLDFVATYILATWTYDRYDAVSYLAFTGDPGSGKTRALTVLSYLCYMAYRGSGSDTEAAILRSIDAVKGTLILDEMQRDLSDPTNDLHKLITLGNEKGNVINKCAGEGDTLHARSFSVFGPKVLGGQYLHTQSAVSSRTYEIVMKKADPTKSNICIRLNNTWLSAAADLRNDLLLYRQDQMLASPPSLANSQLAELNAAGLDMRDIQVHEWLLMEAASESVKSVIIGVIQKKRPDRLYDLEHQFDNQVLIATFEVMKEVVQNPGVLDKCYLGEIILRMQKMGHINPQPRTISNILKRSKISTKRCKHGYYVNSPLKIVESKIEDKGLGSFVGLNGTGAQ